ncbi:sirohydrochlorin nickelochelatase [Methanimicrococcus blatticola]|uniref:Sirohydrochlorin cobaltochelatase n=1 Tax=Methanimicrococcus blatticola TaxID=91560 RepID=A0A484F455_9EURY|nr:sirohydrochlorin nickelochelatase [Methanimicrococcus blatticola]MBZ3935597.1 sirohydrochlorin nickelochelatase [Methanimicrococcus blatticola]MCC2509238.1 sirohydrochlorin nickelochelatase [Methanimicrococcus blatticola]TDQ69396.1 sirohydrochlorin cobaltochelatase [Methanimicrococcus blatticola]
MVKETLLLVGHGSKLPYSKQLILDVAEKVKARNEFENVEIGLMEFNEPSIPDALKKIIDGGSKKIIVVPVFLAPGTHTEKDIPRILGLLKEEECACSGHKHDHDGHDHHGHDDHHHDHDHKHEHGHAHGHGHHHGHHHGDPVDIPEDVEIIYKKPLGADDRIVDIVMERALNS